MDELKEYCTKRNKLDTKIYMSHNFIYVKHLEKDKFIDTEVWWGRYRALNIYSYNLQLCILIIYISPLIFPNNVFQFSVFITRYLLLLVTIVNGIITLTLILIYFW